MAAMGSLRPLDRTVCAMFENDAERFREEAEKCRHQAEKAVDPLDEEAWP